MRYKAEHKDAARAAIVRHAAKRLRADGLVASGVRTLMADAGLTHGAFYAHFESRDALIGEAVSAAAAETLGRIESVVVAAPPDSAARALVESYLGAWHSDRIDRGCAMAALAAEFTRGESAGRGALLAGLERFAELIETLLPPGGSKDERSRRAYGVFAGMMGSLQLSRLTSEPQMRDHILEAGREAALGLIEKSWNNHAIAAS